MTEKTQPIIVKKVKKHEHGHHGGSWKVAYADFVTAMMAFFLLMWLMTAATPDEKLAIAGFFSNPSAVTGGGGPSSNLLSMGSSMDLGNVGLGQNPAPNYKGEDMSAKVYEQSDKSIDKATLDALEQMEKAALVKLLEELKGRVEESESLKDFKDQILMNITDDGLRVQIVDKENRPMFALGSAELQSYTTKILHEVAKVVSMVPNKISVTGHTDALRYSAEAGYTNWELSADRANAARRELLLGGMAPDKISRVVGLADTIPHNRQDPNDPANRRISIIVLKKKAQDAIVRSAEGTSLEKELSTVLPAQAQVAPVKDSVPVEATADVSHTANAPIVPHLELPALPKATVTPPIATAPAKAAASAPPMQIEPIKLPLDAVLVPKVDTGQKTKTPAVESRAPDARATPSSGASKASPMPGTQLPPPVQIEPIINPIAATPVPMR